ASPTGSDGYRARASARPRPAFSPRRAAASFNAVICCAPLMEATTTRGPSAGADRRRSIRSVGSRRSHTDRYRRLESTLMMVPLDDPTAGRSAPVLAERKVETRAAQAAAEAAIGVGLAQGRRNHPAGRRRARHGGDFVTD